VKVVSDESVSELIVTGISRLKYYLAVLILSAFVLIVVNTYTTLILEKTTKELVPIELTRLYMNTALTLVFWIAPLVIYYTATRVLSVWSEKFTSYRQLVGAFIAILLLQRALAVYQLYVAINEYNSSLAQSETPLKDPVSTFGLTVVYEYLTGSVFTIILIGILHLITRESGKITELSESREATSSVTEDLCSRNCKLDEAVVYLKVSQAHFIVGGIFVFLHADMRIPGLVILAFGLALLVKGSISSIRKLGKLVEHLKPATE